MKEFLEYSLAYAIILGALVMLGGAYVLIFGGVLLVGMLFAAIHLSYKKNREDLARIEKKLDQLLEQKSEQEN